MRFIHLAARHEEVLLELVALDAVRIQRILNQLARLRFVHPRQHAEINQQPYLSGNHVILLIALHHCHNDGR